MTKKTTHCLSCGEWLEGFDQCSACGRINKSCFSVTLFFSKIMSLTKWNEVVPNRKMNNIIMNMTQMQPKLSRTWLAGGNKYYPSRSVVITIPAEYAHAYNLREPSTVLITPTEEGILIKKVELPT